MTTSLVILILLGMGSNWIFTKMKLPGLLGMLLLGILVGPYALNWLDPAFLKLSDDLRKIALIIILLRAGMGISKKALKSVGATAMKMSCIPGIIEGFTITFFAMQLLNFSFIEAGILGFVIAAVSPAVVVPLMLELHDKKIGTDKQIPTLILTSASIDDVFAITIFSTFTGLYAGNNVNIAMKIMQIPLSIISGIAVGIFIALIIVKMFKTVSIRDTRKVLIILGAATLLTVVESTLKKHFEIAGLLGVMAIGFILLEKIPEKTRRMAHKYSKIWIFAEILLFVLVGAQVNISVALQSGLTGLMIIGLGLVGRSIGVVISTLRSPLNWKERFFCVIAYLPKATVQAAIGTIPLSLGIPSGEVILAIAVLSILVTAPLGAIGIKAGAGALLRNNSV